MSILEKVPNFFWGFLPHTHGMYTVCFPKNYEKFDSENLWFGVELSEICEKKWKYICSNKFSTMLVFPPCGRRWMAKSINAKFSLITLNHLCSILMRKSLKKSLQNCYKWNRDLTFKSQSIADMFADYCMENGNARAVKSKKKRLSSKPRIKKPIERNGF